jgi:YD repeat-containing protein
MRILWLTLGVAGLASARCYQFSGPGFTYTMNIMSVSSATPSLDLMQFIVQQQSTLTLGGTTYVGAVGPANLAFQSDGGISTVMTAVINILTEPVWQAGVFLVGNLSFLPGSPPASLPPISAWQVQTPFLGESVNGGAENKLTITFVGSCSGSTGTGTGTGSTSISGQSLGDTLSNPGSCNCDDPIDLGSGNLFLKRRDYQTAGPNQLSFIRYYNSLGDPNSLATTLGPRWRTHFDRYLQISASSVTAERPDGSEISFTLTGGAWTTDTDIDVKLTNSGTTWTLVDKNDTVETYTATGATKALLQTIQTRNGYTQTMQYNGSSLLSSVTDSYNRQLTLAYQNNLLQSVTTPEALVLTFAYTSGELTSAQFSTSPATTESYLYENSALPNNLTGIVDEDGNRYLTWTYDSKGRALTGQLADGADLNTIVYNDNDGSRMVTGPLGLEELYKFNTLQNVPKVIEVDRLAGPTVIASTRTFSYDTNGYVASSTDWNGNTTTFVNDAHGQPTNVVLAAGTPQARTTQITYHPTFHLPVQVVSPGLNISFTYDRSGELLTKTLTDTTTTSTPYSTSGQTRTWTFTWSNFLVASAKSPRTDLSSVTGFGYDSTGALTSVTNALNQITQITQHTGGGRPLTIIDANGVQTSLAYDGRQRLISSTVNTAAGALTTKLVYDSAGNLLTVTEPDGSALTYSYDAAHRIVGASDLLGEKLLVTLDANGDRAQTIAQDSSGGTHFTRMGVFDALGRITQVTAGAGQVTTFSYDSNGNRVTTMDPLKTCDAGGLRCAQPCRENHQRRPGRDGHCLRPAIEAARPHECGRHHHAVHLRRMRRADRGNQPHHGNRRFSL